MKATTKKLFLTTVLSAASVMSFAYTATFTNNGNTQVLLKAAGNTVCTIAAKGSTTCSNLDAYTAYAASYKGTNADQGLFTIQKNSSQVLQVTPVTANTALANFIININADGRTGTVDNFQNSAAQFVSSGSCANDSGGVTCQLSTGDNLQNLSIALDEKQEPKSSGGDTPTSTAVKSASGMYYNDKGNWNSSTTYDAVWDNVVSATAYPMVKDDDNKTYVACYAAPLGQHPKDVVVSQSWGPWFQFDVNQSSSPCPL